MYLAENGRLARPPLISEIPGSSAVCCSSSLKRATINLPILKRQRNAERHRIFQTRIRDWDSRGSADSYGVLRLCSVKSHLEAQRGISIARTRYLETQFSLFPIYVVFPSWQSRFEPRLPLHFFSTTCSTSAAMPADHNATRFVGGSGRGSHFGSASFTELSPGLSLSRCIVTERSSPSRVRFAAPNNGAPLTAPGRSEKPFLIREKGPW
jgi:hypothetical protein